MASLIKVAVHAGLGYCLGAVVGGMVGSAMDIKDLQQEGVDTDKATRYAEKCAFWGAIILAVKAAASDD